jgi:hypothetical protein
MTETTNLKLTQPAYNSTSPTWDQPLNNNATILDYAYGATTSISMPVGASTDTDITAPSATPTANTSQAMRILLQSGSALINNQTLRFPAGVSGRWIVTNNCTGTVTVTMKVVGGSQTITAPQGYSICVFSTGTELYLDNDGLLQVVSTITASTITATTSLIGRYAPRVTTITSSATPAPNADTTDQYQISALATTITSFGAPTGTGIVNGQKLLIRIYSAATQNITAWDSGTGGYAAIGVTLPTATVAGKYLYVGCIYNSTSLRWDVVAVQQQS